MSVDVHAHVCIVYASVFLDMHTIVSDLYCNFMYVTSPWPLQLAEAFKAAASVDPAQPVPLGQAK